MSAKYFCDACGVAVTKRNSPKGENGRVVRTLGNMTIEILVARGGTWNAGEFCVACILKAVVKGKDKRHGPPHD